MRHVLARRVLAQLLVRALGTLLVQPGRTLVDLRVLPTLANGRIRPKQLLRAANADLIFRVLVHTRNRHVRKLAEIRNHPIKMAEISLKGPVLRVALGREHLHSIGLRVDANEPAPVLHRNLVVQSFHDAGRLKRIGLRPGIRHFRYPFRQ